ncbi:MAG: DnaA/Hda family protein [Thermoplasmata archaeon]
MSAELRIPEGIVVRTARGGPGVLAGILSDLKQYTFTGYVKVILKKESMSSTGYLVVDQGMPTMSIYQFEKKEPREIKRIYAGDKSMRFILEDAQDRQAVIELHSRVPKEEFDRRFPDAKLLEMDSIDLKSLIQPEERRVAETKEKERPEEIEPPPSEETDPVLGEILELRRQGYVVDELEKLFRQSKAGAKKALAEYKEKIDDLKKLEKQLDSLPQVGFENEIQALKLRLSDPSDIDNIKADFVSLKEKIRRHIEEIKIAEKKIEEDLKRKQRDAKTGDLYDLILQYQRGEIPKQEVPTCEKCGSVLDGDGSCPKCKGEESSLLALTEGMGFQSFVVGKSNKFAYAAAVAVAHAPDKAYNPLFLYGKSGLGKTHLLNAIARQIMAKSSKDSIVLLPAEKFAEELDLAIKRNDVHGLRDRLRRKKLFMIDDFQFLAGKEAAQVELLYLIEDTLRNGGQVVIASDRLPKEIPKLSEHLAAKIQGGMIADIQPPDKQTRVEILKRKAKEKGREIPAQVIEFISDRIESNVRELEAALNRLIAFATVMKLDIDLQLAKEVLTPTLGAPEKEGVHELEVKPGHSYLIEEDRPTHSNLLLARMIKEGYRGLEITRMNPGKVRSDYGISGEIIWLTDKESKNERTIPPSLEMIVHTIEEFLGQGEKGILLIDGLQYLISNTSFDGVLRFLRRLIDEFSESDSIMMISVSPGTLKPQEISILEREFEVLKPTG